MQLKNVNYHKLSLLINFTFYYSLLVIMRIYLVTATEISSKTMKYDNKPEVILEMIQNCYSSFDVI